MVRLPECRMSALQNVLLYSLPGAVLLVAGGAVGAFWKIGANLRSMLQHFAAGMVFAVVAVELLPQVRRDASPLWIALGFTAGVAAMLGVRRLEGKPEEKGDSGGWPWGLLIALGVDVFIDGLLLGLGFSVGGKQGVMLASALAAELLCLGLTASATLKQSMGGRRAIVIATTATIAAPFLAGSLLGGSLLQGLSGNFLGGVISFGCAALLYLVTEELLVEAHETEHTVAAAAMFFAAFELFLLLGMSE